MRVSDPNFPMPGITLWGPDKDHGNITPGDINQGYLGNCWVMAAVSALAERNNRITKFMVSDEIDKKAGIYAMNMYVLGVPFTMIIDDYLPLHNGKVILAELGKDGSVWGALVEKAFAKYYGNWEHLVAGDTSVAVSALNGSPA